MHAISYPKIARKKFEHSASKLEDIDIAMKTAVIVGASRVSLVLVVSPSGFLQFSSKDNRRGVLV